ncbi:MAG: ADP-ribosylglycohydrolase family protein [Lachnospiraceae bacterium]|nr:ADP-ribosylglycohydrolase family protein [Lachnospiraceae bacterium]
MYGAILGDMIGSPFEFDRGSKTKDFPLLSEESHYTDDSVMTIAIAMGIFEAGLEAGEQEMKAAMVKYMRLLGNRYAAGEYGTRFSAWLAAADPKPYGSYGNGAAMRVSSIGWLFPSLERTREVARWSAEVTHNHPEGVKGAEAVASIIFLARTGLCETKEQIKDFVVEEFGYDLSRTCDEIRPSYHHVESCQETVPEAITAFLEGVDFEDVVRTAVSLGGDTDTVGAIAGSMAEAFYGIPMPLLRKCKERIPEEWKTVLTTFVTTWMVGTV